MNTKSNFWVGWRRFGGRGSLLTGLVLGLVLLGGSGALFAQDYVGAAFCANCHPLDPSEADNYGDWRTPVTEFNCTTGTPNLVISRTFRSVALFLTRLAHFAHGDPAEYAKLRATLVADGMLRDEDGMLRLERDI